MRTPMQEELQKPVSHFVQQLAKQGQSEGRPVMHDARGQPVVALVYMRGDVPERLAHLDKFVGCNAPLAQA